MALEEMAPEVAEVKAPEEMVTVASEVKVVLED